MKVRTRDEGFPWEENSNQEMVRTGSFNSGEVSRPGRSSSVIGTLKRQEFGMIYLFVGLQAP